MRGEPEYPHRGQIQHPVMPALNILRRVKVAKNVQAHHETIGVIILKRAQFAIQLRLKEFAMALSMRPLHVVAVAIVPMLAIRGAGSALLQRKSKYRHPIPRAFNNVAADLSGVAARFQNAKAMARAAVGEKCAGFTNGRVIVL